MKFCHRLMALATNMVEARRIGTRNLPGTPLACSAAYKNSRLHKGLLDVPVGIRILNHHDADAEKCAWSGDATYLRHQIGSPALRYWRSNENGRRT